MDIEELGRIRDREREKDSLQHLPDDFYSAVGTYLEELRADRDAAAAEAADPFDDPEVRRLSDELQTAERIVEAVYERRVGKIVKLASFEAADMSAEREGLTTEEQALCDAIVERIRDNRDRVLSTISPDPVDESEADAEAADAYTRDGTAQAESADPAEDDGESAEERTTVRITQDLGEIVGTDERTYHLAADDIVSLPTKNAEPLVSRGAAEPVE